MLMARRGRKRGLELEAEYWRLLAGRGGCRPIGASPSVCAVPCPNLAPVPPSFRSSPRVSARHRGGRRPWLAFGPLRRERQRPGRPRSGDPLLRVLVGGRRPCTYRRVRSRPGLGLGWATRAALWEHEVEETRTWPCWQPPKPPPATTPSSPHLNRRTDLIDAVPASRGDRLRPCGRELRDEDVPRTPALSRPERRAVPGPPMVAHHPLHPAPAE
ncbi:hypothetical protein E5N77_35995 [Streptomyces sp. SS52]|nr:hypothetical protein E5N77_35995 [Streptomyces sp. SS52]